MRSSSIIRTCSSRSPRPSDMRFTATAEPRHQALYTRPKAPRPTSFSICKSSNFTQGMLLDEEEVGEEVEEGAVDVIVLDAVVEAAADNGSVAALRVVYPGTMRTAGAGGRGADTAADAEAAAEAGAGLCVVAVAVAGVGAGVGAVAAGGDEPHECCTFLANRRRCSTLTPIEAKSSSNTSRRSSGCSTPSSSSASRKEDIPMGFSHCSSASRSTVVGGWGARRDMIRCSKVLLCKLSLRRLLAIVW